MKQQLKKPSNVPNKIEIKVVSFSFFVLLFFHLFQNTGAAEHYSGGLLSPGLIKFETKIYFCEKGFETLLFFLQVHSIPSNKVDTLKTKLWIEFDGEVTIGKSILISNLL